MKFKRILLTLLLSGALLESNADVGNALVDYYNSMQANSKVERATVTTNGVTLGGFYQRNANVDLTLGYITPPSLKGGCGNIDFNMGAFSFISGDQIVAALKAIGQNAQGLLFTEAIDIVSAQLGGNIKMWIDQANKWLGVLKNSCQAASMLVGGVNKAAGLCQNSARYKNTLSDENTVQSTCQTFDQGVKPYKELFSGGDSAETANARSALATQIKLQGGLVQNMLSEYFASAGRANEMESDLGNLVLSVVGDVYIPPLEKGNDDQAQGTPLSIPPAKFKLSDLLSINIENSIDQATNSNWQLYNCTFTYDSDTFRSKDDCFNPATKNYNDASGKNAAALSILINTKLTTLHNKLINLDSKIDNADLTLLSLSDAPIFQLMQAGVDTNMDQITYPIVENWMTYTVHKIYYQLFVSIQAALNTQIAALMSGSEDQKQALNQIASNLENARIQIDNQLKFDMKKNKLDPMDVLNRLNTIRTAIANNVSPGLQQQLLFTKTALRD